ncbi:MAG: hypothetical protein MH252_03360 [Thermosynechococcaceae cyanobacterium MS004]|nr:hypothetical protein [Thermosynechococcaceae cyanobacterium MS004]
MVFSQLDVNIGIDFGTSFTKVCLWDEDTASRVVTFAGASLKDSLLLSKVAILPDHRLVAGLTESEWQIETRGAEIEIDFIKMRLANFDLEHEGHWFSFTDISSYARHDLNQRGCIENLCIFYLARVIQRSKKWFIHKFPNLVKNQEINWSANIGVPVRYYNSKALETFQKVLGISFLICNSTEADNLEKFTLEDLDRVVRFLEPNLSKNIPCFAIPEVAAGTYAFTASRSAKEGDYTFIDIGSGTVESVFFSFDRETRRPRIKVLCPYVHPLGIDTLIEGVSKISNIPRIELEKLLLNGNSIVDELHSIIQQYAKPLTKKDFVAAVAINGSLDKESQQYDDLYISQQRLESLMDDSEIIINPRNRVLMELMLWQMAIHLQTSKVINYKQKKTEIFLCGGGARILFYTHSIRATQRAFSQYRATVKPYQFKELFLPNEDELSMSDLSRNEFSRFNIAYGLSLPPSQMPMFTLPDSCHSAQIDGLLRRDVARLATLIRQETATRNSIEVDIDWRERPNQALGGRVQA